MPLMAVTEVAMPACLQRMAFKTISSAVTPLQNFLRSSSLPLSRPIYTMPRPCSRSVRSSSSVLRMMALVVA